MTLGKSYNGNKIHLRIGYGAAWCNSRGGIAMMPISIQAALITDERHYCRKCIGTKEHLQKLVDDQTVIDP